MYQRFNFHSENKNKWPPDSSGVLAAQRGDESVGSGPRSVSRLSVDGTPKKWGELNNLKNVKRSDLAFPHIV